MAFEWKDTYLQGDTVIDAQHQHLFEIAKKLMSATEVDVVKRLTVALYRHARIHFEYEESVMRKHHYPALASHIEAHLTLLERLNQVSLDRATVDALMTDLVITHIEQEDTMFTDYVRFRQAQRGLGVACR